MSLVKPIVLYLVVTAVLVLIYFFVVTRSSPAVSRAQWIRANKLCYVTGVDKSGAFYCDNGWRLKIDQIGGY